MSRRLSDNVGNLKEDYSIVALKGVIGIGAMSQICEALNRSEDAKTFRAEASSLAQQWQRLTVKHNPDHITHNYEDDTSFTLAYDLYADILLGTKLINESVYNVQTTHCQEQLSAEMAQGNFFGIPLSSASGFNARSTWTMFTATTVTDNNTRNSLVQSVFARASFNQSEMAVRNFPVIYNVKTGQPQVGASPQQGSMFSFLALGASNNTSSSNTTASPNPQSSNKAPQLKLRAGSIAGIVLGSVGAVGLLSAVIIFTRKRKRTAATLEPFLGQIDDVQPRFLDLVSSRGAPQFFTQQVPSSAPHPKITSSTFATRVSPQTDQNPDLQFGREQLRDDVDMLRREIEEMRLQRGYVMAPPPEYV
ncbi:hypothetical protein VKT23_007774 [Stygiomarasmius scandens]|uniref:Glutaminase A central domain-containing protein n=1 Tax=Marasmiellus scandens TaxID=2682957 RepID=A0ABR1JNS2_9AGAR